MSNSRQFASSKLNELATLKKSNVSFPENPVSGSQINENTPQSKPPSRNKSQVPMSRREESDGFKEVRTYYGPDGSQMRVTEELKNVEGDPFKVHLNTLIGKNKDYFEHLGGHCVCGMCICGRCKCPKKNLNTDYLHGNNSEYQNKYIPHKCLDNLPTLKADFFTSQYTKSPLDYSTTNRNDYKPPGSSSGLQNGKREKPNKDYAPFLGSSSYRNEYVNWGANPSSNLKPGYQATVIKELPFVGRTIYRDNYQGNQSGKDSDMAKLISNSRYGVFRSPVSPDFPFMGDTTHNSTYKPFKTMRAGDANSGRKSMESMPSYAGQFLSTHDKDFDQKGIRKCPAREVLNRLYQQGVISWGR